MFLIIGVFPLCLKAASFQDTISIKYDSTFCVNKGDTVKFESSLDTSVYDFLWVRLNNESDTLSTSNSLPVYQNDSIIRKSFPRDTINPYYIDTILIKIHFYPIPDLEIDTIECYNGAPIKIVTNAKLDTSYNKDSISFFDQLNQPLSNINYTKDADNYLVDIGNGDTIIVKLKYSTVGCPDSNLFYIEIGTKFLPQIRLESDTVCFGDSTMISNLSNFDEGLSSVNISIEGIVPDFTEKGNFKCFIDTNGDTRELMVTINQQGCIEDSLFFIQNLQTPVPNFGFDKTCENKFLNINNSSSFTTIDFTIEFSIFNKSYNFGSVNTINIPDTIPDGVHIGLLTIKNNNGCSDSISKAVSIDSVTYVWFTGLEMDYCVNQDSSLLMGSQNGGVFSGLFLNDISPGKAILRPTSVVSNFEILYTFTNGVQCTDSYSQEVENVYPKPSLQLFGLDNAYCEKDSPINLSINQSIENQSIFTIIRDGLPMDTSIGLNYVFDPLVPGFYSIINFFTDQNGCFSEIQNSTVVNPLPLISLDSLIVLKPGDVILVGNNLQNEPEVSYLWSNGDTSPSTNLDQPGLYLLYAVNNLTLCEVSDTILIEYDKNIKDEIFQIEIFPNPTTDKINISLSSPKSDIKLIRLNGNTVSLNGATSFSTDIFGKLILDVENISSGYYCLKIPDVGDFIVLKI